MGRRDKERIERIRQGLEEPMARQRLADKSYNPVVKELSKGGTDKQIGRLDTMVSEGSLSGKRLRDAITDNAPKEMDKAIWKLQKKGKPVTVDALCAEVEGNKQFLVICDKVGLDLSWFENLAKLRMEALGVEA